MNIGKLVELSKLKSAFLSFSFVLFLLFQSLTLPTFAQNLPIAINNFSNLVKQGEYYSRIEDVIYGRKYGTALTLDVIKPKKNSNGLGIIAIISGGYFSGHDAIRPEFYRPLLDRGYTIFAVVHGSQPKFQIPEIFQDVKRAVRFVRYNAKEFGINPSKIGATGGSAGGHLSLLLGTTADEGNPNARDTIERVSAKVQAVACFFPPTDFLNWQENGRPILKAMDIGKPFRPAFDYHELNNDLNIWERITEESKLIQITRSISPIYHIDSADAPTLIIHGDQDNLVPLRQSESMIAKLKEAGVEARLIVKKGAGHGWMNQSVDLETFADWFDKYLKPSK
jgi:acetyl esterase/lipase